MTPCDCPPSHFQEQTMNVFGPQALLLIFNNIYGRIHSEQLIAMIIFHWN